MLENKKVLPRKINYYTPKIEKINKHSCKYTGNIYPYMMAIKKKVQYITNMFSNYNRQKTEIEYKLDYL